MLGLDAHSRPSIELTLALVSAANSEEAFLFGEPIGGQGPCPASCTAVKATLNKPVISTLRRSGALIARLEAVFHVNAAFFGGFEAAGASHVHSGRTHATRRLRAM